MPIELPGGERISGECMGVEGALVLVGGNGGKGVLSGGAGRGLFSGLVPRSLEKLVAAAS